MKDTDVPPDSNQVPQHRRVFTRWVKDTGVSPDSIKVSKTAFLLVLAGVVACIAVVVIFVL